MLDAARIADDAWRAGLAPEPQFTVSEWADRHRQLPDTSSEPGQWRTSRTPFLRDIMDALSVASTVERVVFMKGAQIGATEAGLNWLGYVIANAPGLALYVLPTGPLATRTVMTRLDPMIEATPELKNRVTPKRSRDPGNSNTMKTFPGGQIVLTGANSAVGLRSTPARYLFLDEIDGYPHDADGEGDPIALAEQRTVTFKGRRKIFIVSTPTVAGISRIEKAFEESDQRRYFVPCPHCGAFQWLRWSNVRWTEDRRAAAWYACEHCHAEITERHKPAMIAQGEWRPTVPGDGTTAGFHLSALYSPFESWGEIAVQHGDVRRDPSRLQTWTNLKLGETWEDRTAKVPEPARLQARCEPFGPGVPNGVVAITCGVDVQQDRLELEIVGWGRGEESWSLAYHSLTGNPAEPALWTRLDSLLLAPIGGRRIMAACVDSGNWTKTVYDFTATRHGRRVWAIKGASSRSTMIWPRRPARPKPGRPPLYIVGTDAGKEIIVARLQLEEPGPGFCHFPVGRDLDFFSMLTAEKPVRSFVRGVAVRTWKKAPHARNEALDARVYALAALHGLYAAGFSLDREADKARDTPPDAQPQTAAPPRVTRSKFLDG